MLPEVVQRQGVTVSKSTRNYLMLSACLGQSGDRSERPERLCHLPDSAFRGAVPGVGESRPSAPILHASLDESRQTHQYNMTIGDIIRNSHLQRQVSAGQFGGSPAVPARAERLHLS